MNPLQQMMPQAMPPQAGGGMAFGGNPDETGEPGEQIALPLLLQALQALMADAQGGAGGGMAAGGAY